MKAPEGLVMQERERSIGQMIEAAGIGRFDAKPSIWGNPIVEVEGLPEDAPVMVMGRLDRERWEARDVRITADDDGIIRIRVGHWERVS